jgi:hypothetical protein
LELPGNENNPLLNVMSEEKKSQDSNQEEDHQLEQKLSE